MEPNLDRATLSLGGTVVGIVATLVLTSGALAQDTVRARVQLRPGGPEREVDMKVHEVPVNPRTVSASDANLRDEELVLGVVVDGQPVAYPIRYLALTEVLNDEVQGEALAPTW